MSLQQCNQCGKIGHSRITSKLCALNAEYKNASADGRTRLLKRCRANRDAKRARTPERKEAMRIAAAKYNPKRARTPERKEAMRIAAAKHDAKRARTPERKISRKRWKKKNVCDDMSRAIAKESRIHGIYAANSRKFACCAAAHIAKQVASHVSMNEEDVKRILTPLQDSEILRIKKQWDVHMAMGANSQTCSTCGIIGLADPREYPLQNLCLNAFKVIGFCGCVFLIRCVTVLPTYAGFCRYMQGRARSCLVF